MGSNTLLKSHCTVGPQVVPPNWHTQHSAKSMAKNAKTKLPPICGALDKDDPHPLWDSPRVKACTYACMHVRISVCNCACLHE